jgi:hypothetical protein
MPTIARDKIICLSIDITHSELMLSISKTPIIAPTLAGMIGIATIVYSSTYQPIKVVIAANRPNTMNITLIQTFIAIIRKYW